MIRAKELLKMLHKRYRRDHWIAAMYNAIGIELDQMDIEIRQIGLNSFFDTMSEKALKLEEKQLGLKPRPDMTLAERAAAVEAKWKAGGKISVELLQSIADSWKNGETVVSFADTGAYEVIFTGAFGVPTDLQSLKNAINEVKQPYIPIEFLFRYLLIENIHEAMTVEVMERQVLSNFAGGGTNG